MSSHINPRVVGVAGNWNEIDSSTARYVSLGQDFHFVESCAKNAVFDPEHVYIPMQKKDFTLHIYKLAVNETSTSVEEGKDLQDDLKYVGQVTKPDGEVKLAPFGSALDSRGIMWICCFNENMLVGFDLKNRATVATVCCPAPNDVCLNEDEQTLYAGCGSRLGKVAIGAGRGTVYRAPNKVGTATEPFINEDAEVVLFGCQGTMAGIAVKGDKAYCAHLMRMAEYQIPKKRVLRGDIRHKSEMIWSGYDKEVKEFFLCDNLSWWSEDELLTPLYRTVSGGIGTILDVTPTVQCIGWCCARTMTELDRLRVHGIDEVARVNDDSVSPEVDLSYSMGDFFPYPHFSIYNLKTGKSTNYKMKCGTFFDGHVTHAERFNGHIVLVNFQKSFIGLVPESALKSAESS